VRARRGVWISAGCGLAMMLAACHPTSPPRAVPPPSALEIGDRFFDAGDAPAAAAAYERHLESGDAVAGGDRALFRLALLELSGPGEPRAEGFEKLRRLVSSHPESLYRGAAERLLGFEAETRRLREQSRALREQLDALKAIDLEPPANQ